MVATLDIKIKNLKVTVLLEINSFLGKIFLHCFTGAGYVYVGGVFASAGSG